MRKKLLIFCFAAVLAANGGICRSYALNDEIAANDTVSQETTDASDESNGASDAEQQIETSMQQSGSGTDIDAETAAEETIAGEEVLSEAEASLTENTEAAELTSAAEETLISGKKQSTAVTSHNAQKKIGAAECVLIAIMSCLSAFVGAAAMYAAAKKNRSAASDGSMLSASIDSAMNNVKRIRSEIKQISGSIDGLAAAGGTEKYAGGTTNMEVTVSSLKNNIAFIKEIVSSMGAAASKEPTAESERMGYAHEKADIPTMTVSEMFNKVSELRSIAEPNQFLDYNESEGKTVRSAKNDYRKEADYIFEAVGENKYFIYINRNSFFNAADVSNRLFEVKADGTIRGDVLFRPCVSDNGVFIKGKLG